MTGHNAWQVQGYKYINILNVYMNANKQTVDVEIIRRKSVKKRILNAYGQNSVLAFRFK